MVPVVLSSSAPQSVTWGKQGSVARPLQFNDTNGSLSAGHTPSGTCSASFRKTLCPPASASLIPENARTLTSTTQLRLILLHQVSRLWRFDEQCNSEGFPRLEIEPNLLSQSYDGKEQQLISDEQEKGLKHSPSTYDTPVTDWQAQLFPFPRNSQTHFLLLLLCHSSASTVLGKT